MSSGLSFERITELLHFGAIYLDGHRVFKDTSLHSNQTLRLHTSPKRFPVATIDWKQRILHLHEDFIVFDKPAGVPVHATLDNAIENSLYQLSLCLNQKLYPAHRLDIDTSGVCVLGRKAKFQSVFHASLRSPSSSKIYFALCESPLKPGLYEHYMEKQKQPPHKMFLTEDLERKLCRLEILDCVAREAGSFVIKIRLLTGRTHQIRAQLSALGSPLKGDTLYGGSEGSSFLLHASSLNFKYEGEEFYLEAPLPFT